MRRDKQTRVNATTQMLRDLVATRWAPTPWAMATRAGVVLAALCAPAVIAAWGGGGGEDGTTRESLQGLVEKQEGLIVDAESIHWIDRPVTGVFSDWFVARASVMARTDENALRDLYMARVRLAPSGRVASVDVTNLTRSYNASEQAFLAHGEVLVVAALVDDSYVALEMLDFAGEDEEVTRDWPWVEKAKDAVTNLQKTGQTQGISRVRYEMVNPSRQLHMELDGDDTVVSLDQGVIRLKKGRIEPLQGADLVTVKPPIKAMSGHVAWMVDSVRAIPMIGTEKIGWLESRFYNLKDSFMRSFYKLAGEKYAAREIEKDMGFDGAKPYVMKLPEQLKEMDLGWPPPPIPADPDMEPLDREGEWVPFSDMRFTRSDPGHPYPFVTSFMRPDPERTYASISLVAWDPRMVEIHMQAGVVEPISDTGAAGTGMIPRDDDTMLRLLAAFNGGFQALHGEFGMMQDGKVYLPPKPWAATVARLKGGRMGFGTWPGPEVGDIPPQMESYRQNLTPLMQDGEINPYRRSWWGSSPDLNPDSPKINRSGICWTEQGHVIYGLAKSVDETGFARGLERAGCRYLIQLDVNSGHSGFEFYRVDPAVHAPALENPLDREAEQEGEVRDRPDLLFRARKMFKSMVLMRFPRFIQRDPRDYFYLTLARHLPGPGVGTEGEGEPVQWKVKGLPGNTTYPARFAMLTLRSDQGTGDPVHVVQVDPRWITLTATTGGAQSSRGAIWYPPATQTAIQPEGGQFVLGFLHDPLGDEWYATSGIMGEELTTAAGGFAFAVVSEEQALAGGPLCGVFGLGPGRFVTWAETAGGDPRRLVDALHAIGVTTVLGVEGATAGGGCGWVFDYGAGGSLIPLVDETLASAPSGRWGLGMLVHEREPIVRLFPDTGVVLPRVWNPGQTKRIRYFHPETEEAPDGEVP